jgi:CTP synthase
MLDDVTCRKIAQFTNVDPDAVFTSPELETTIYQLPIVFFDQKLDEVILRKMGIQNGHAEMSPWYNVMKKHSARKGKVRIGIVGKYMKAHDTYTSLFEALFHASLECGVEVELVKINSSRLEEIENPDEILGQNDACADGILVPGGFDHRGINGMIKAVTWARENKKPYFGICLGMHVMVIDWARNVLKWSDADSSEFSSDVKHPVVSPLEEQVNVKNYGRTMRLGASETVNEEGSHIMAAYGEKHITERHRHRYEFSNQYRDDMAKSGLKLAAFNSDGTLVDCIEWPTANHTWGVGVQFHPEFKSKPTAVSPLFKDFINACLANNSQTDKNCQ